MNLLDDFRKTFTTAYGAKDVNTCSEMIMNLLAAVYPYEMNDKEKLQILKEEIPLRVKALIQKVPSPIPVEMLDSYLLEYGRNILLEIDEED